MPQSNPAYKSALIVLAAGTVTQDFVSVLDAMTPAMLPYMGRPLIYQVIVNHIKKYGRDIMIAVPENEPRLEDFLRASFSDRVNLRIVRVPAGGNGPTASLAAVLRDCPPEDAQKPAFVVYGDVYFEAPCVTINAPTAYVQDYIESDKYSYFQQQDGIYRYIQQRAAPQSDDPPLLTDIGAYWVPRLTTLQEAITSPAVARTMGALMEATYGADLHCEKAFSWSDLGHLDTATQIRTRLIGAREFNSLSIDEERGLITKRSRKNDKILQEINYYQKLPHALSIYFPRLFDATVGSDVSYTLEFYSYRTLAEYFVFFNFPVSVWQKILGRLLHIHQEFTAHAGRAVLPEQVLDFYVGKLESRIADISPESAIFPLVHAPQITVNGQTLAGWSTYRDKIDAAVRKLATHTVPSVVHGDLCFSNILYDPQTSLIKLIDPRGDFFEEGCYGDPRYDLAKLLHSFHGGYDYIMQEMYTLTDHGDGCYDFRLLQSANATAIAEQLLSLLGSHTDYDVQELLLLEALLFLSMLPLHSDDVPRQKALYITGIRILHEVFA